jgi:hypothetical protein
MVIGNNDDARCQLAFPLPQTRQPAQTIRLSNQKARAAAMPGACARAEAPETAFDGVSSLLRRKNTC